MQPGILFSWATDSAFRLEHKFKLVFQVHVTERVIQGLVADHLVVVCASAATRLGIEVFDTGIPFAQRLSTKKAVTSLKVEHLSELGNSFCRPWFQDYRQCSNGWRSR